MVAIKVTNSKDIRVANSTIFGYETAIEIENVEGFVSENNHFSHQNNPQILIDNLLNEIRKSRLDNSSRERLYREIINYLLKKQGDEKSLQKKISQYLGSKGVEYFVQLAAAVSAGLILHAK